MPKNIVICSDGTGNEFEPTNTNVVKRFGLLSQDPATVKMICGSAELSPPAGSRRGTEQGERGSRTMTVRDLPPSFISRFVSFVSWCETDLDKAQASERFLQEFAQEEEMKAHGESPLHSTDAKVAAAEMSPKPADETEGRGH